MPQTLASLSLLSRDNDATVNELHELNIKIFQEKNYRCNIENMKVKFQILVTPPSYYNCISLGSFI